jgi:hypothetical protein
MIMNGPRRDFLWRAGIIAAAPSAQPVESGHGPPLPIFATYAAAQAAPPGFAASIQILDRVLPGDGAGGIFDWIRGDQSPKLASDPQHGIYLPAKVDIAGTRGCWKRRQDCGWVNVRWFGAAGDYDPRLGRGTDDTDAVQAAIRFCLSAALFVQNGRRATPLYVPRGTYLIKRSLDATDSTSYAPAFIVFGDGYLESAIYGALSDGVHPILDMVGNTNGGVYDLGIYSGGGAERCGLLLGANEATGSTSGLNMVVERFGSDIGLINLGADLLNLVDPYITSRRGAALITGPGNQNPSRIKSKYAQIAPPNYTKARVTRGWLVCKDPDYPSTWITGGDSFVSEGTYFAVMGGGGIRKGIIHLGYGQVGQQHSLYLFGVRTENQGSDVGLPVITTAARTRPSVMTGGLISGELYSDPGAAILDCPGDKGGVFDYELILTTTSVRRVFSDDSYARNIKITGAGMALGALDSRSSQIDYMGAYDRDVDAILFQNSNVPNIRIRDSAGRDKTPITAFKFNPSAPAIPLFDGGRYISKPLPTARQSYAGGSGLVAVYSWKIPANLMLRPPGTPSNARYMVGRTVLLGQVNSSASKGGQIRVTVSDGMSRVTILDARGIRGYAPGNDGIELILDYYDASTAGAAAWFKGLLLVGEQIFNPRATPGGTVRWTSEITVAIEVLNDGTNPYHFSVIEGHI